VDDLDFNLDEIEAKPLDEIVDTTRFKLAKKLAEGGMGAVYEAIQLGTEGFEKTMAIKTILEDYSTNPEFVEMFIGEAKLVADLVHQNIVQIYQLGKINNIYYIAMEYINGIDLGNFMDKHAKVGAELPVDMATFMISRVCRGLEYAHAKTDRKGNPLGVVHRDISPGNIMMTWEGVVKITDFGIAKARTLMKDREGEVLLGKIQYMSPEQAEFKQTDHRSDIFSLGVVMYELLTGKQLFAHENTIVALRNISVMEIPPIRSANPRVPEAVEKILNKALERDRNKRYQTAGEFGYDLEYYMYNNRFGPTNVTLEKYLAKLFPDKATQGPGDEKRILTKIE
jgi:serine/threonine-protein kinase